MMWQAKLTAAATAAAVLLGGVWVYGASRYQAGYTAAAARAETQQHAATEQLRQQKYQACRTYQAAKAEREAAERIRDETLQALAKSTDFRHLCFDAGGLQQFNDTAIGKD